MPWLELTAPLAQPVLSQTRKLKALPTEIYTTTLNYLLSNDLILRQTLPYLSPSAVLKLAATSRDFRSLIYYTPGALRHLDLTDVKAAYLDNDLLSVFRNADEPERLLTEDEYYSAPLRNIFSKLNRACLLPSVQTLILDGLSVTAELVHGILTDPSLNIRILSLRGVTNLNEGKLQQTLQTVCRPGRPAGTPRLQGLYLFTTPSIQAEIPTPGSSRACSPDLQWENQSKSVDSQNDWYQTRGRVLARPISPEWARTIYACRGIVSFDAILCAGPRHLNSPALGQVDVSHGSGRDVPQWAVATHALDTCSGCGAAPEGVTEWGRAERADCPLLEPAPLHSSTVKAACRPSQVDRASFVARCTDCLWNRYCNSCLKWWCEACYSGAGGANQRAGVAKDCWECGPNCFECISATQRTCKSCCGGYCIVHNEGSTATNCDCKILLFRNHDLHKSGDDVPILAFRARQMPIFE